MMEAQKLAEGRRSALFQLVGASSQRGPRRNGQKRPPPHHPVCLLPGLEGQGAQTDQEMLSSQKPLPPDQPSEADSPTAPPQAISWSQKVSIDSRLEALQQQMHRWVTRPPLPSQQRILFNLST